MIIMIMIMIFLLLNDHHDYDHWNYGLLDDEGDNDDNPQ